MDHIIRAVLLAGGHKCLMSCGFQRAGLRGNREASMDDDTHEMIHEDIWRHESRNMESMAFGIWTSGTRIEIRILFGG